MKLEGKLKEDFLRWLCIKENGNDRAIYGIEKWFKELPQSAQFGLIQEYADMLGYRIVINWEQNYKEPVRWEYFLGKWVEDFKSRPEAQLAVVEKLNEIVNQLKDK